MEILLIALPISALVGYLLGKNKGQGAAGAVGGLLLGPIGWLIVACAKSEGMRKCPYCAEEVKSEASVCRFCSRDLPSLPKPNPLEGQQQLIQKPKPVSAKRQAAVTGAVITLVVGGLIAASVCKTPERLPLRRHIVNGQVVYDNTADEPVNR